MKNTRKPGPGGRKSSSDAPRRPRDGANAASGDKQHRAAPRRDGDRKPSAPRAKPAERNPDHLEVTGQGERISKIMARAGVASRRDCERMIMEGRVKLNGNTLSSPAVNCLPTDLIEVDGDWIGTIERTRMWIYYKPAGLVTTNHDPEGRPTVFDNLPEDLPRVISVGRLDINTEGLLLLTNDGGLARMLELPTTGWLRRYRVRAYGSIDQEKLDSLKDGMAVDGVLYGGIEATLDRQQGHNVWITMGLREGKNREIKNVLGALGLDVNRLIRISYGPFQLGELEDGQVVEIKSRTLRDQLGPRLIADSNANFDAPIHNNLQAAKDDEPAEEKPERLPRLSKEDRRERDLARIDTKKPARAFDKGRKPERGERGGRDFDDSKPKRPPLGTIRTTNVWMAPGARPVADKTVRDAETSEIADASGRKILKLRKPVEKAEGDKPKRAGAKKRPAAKTDRPARAEATGRPARSERPRGDGAERGPARRTDGERQARGPRTERGDDERNRGDMPRGKGPGNGRNFSDKAAGDRGPSANRERGAGPKGKSPRGDGPKSNGPKGAGAKSGGARGQGAKGPGRGADRRR